MIDWEFVKEALRKGKMHKLMDYLSVYGSAMVDEHERLRRENEDLKSQVHYWHDAFEDYKKAFYSEDRGEAVAVLRHENEQLKQRIDDCDTEHLSKITRLQQGIAKLEAELKEMKEERKQDAKFLEGEA